MCLVEPWALAAGDVVDLGVEAHYYPTSRTTFKKVGNARFNFWIDLPAGWHAYDRSANGDGYFLDVGSANVDARAYGSGMDFDLEQSQTKRRFKFADGKMGWRLTKANGVTYIREEDGHFLHLYVQAPEAWFKTNEAVLVIVAQSLRSGSRLP